jgi:octaprenyl-diphosphate synthase
MTFIDPLTYTVKNELKNHNKYLNSFLKTNIPFLNFFLHLIIRKKHHQLRSALVFLSAKLNGKPNETTYITAALIEILHTAALIHSNIGEDHKGSSFPNSMKTLWKSKVAVLFGDYLLAKGLLLAIKTKQYEMLSTISKTIKEMTEGQLMKMNISRKLKITRQQYFEILRKTTVGSITCCIFCGSESVFIKSEKNLPIKNFAVAYGMALQLKDDLIFFKNLKINQWLSEKNINQIRFTLPYIYALEIAGLEEEKVFLPQALSGRKNSVKSKEIIHFVNKNNGISYTIDQYNFYSDLALTALKEFPANEIIESLIFILRRDLPNNYC